MMGSRRLRDAAHDVIGGLAGIKQVDAMIEAADRIDTLEAALREVAVSTRPSGTLYVYAAPIYKVARKALGEAHDG